MFATATASQDALYQGSGANSEVLEAEASFDETEKNGRFCPKYAQTDFNSQPVKDVGRLLAVAAQAKVVYDAELSRIAEAQNMPVVTDSKSLVESGYAAVVLPALKGEERILEKSESKYEQEVQSGARVSPAVAWTTDVVRGSVVCSNESQLASVVAMLQASPVFELVRCKNYFDPKRLDPTHFRRLAYTVRMTVKNGAGSATSHQGEIQLHLTPIFRFMKENKELMHRPYEVFRTIFGAQINAKLASGDGWLLLDARIKNWSSFLEVPVLMALLIITLDKFDFTASASIVDLPDNKVSLYNNAVHIMAEVSQTHVCASQSSWVHIAAHGVRWRRRPMPQLGCHAVLSIAAVAIVALAVSRRVSPSWPSWQPARRQTFDWFCGHSRSRPTATTLHPTRTYVATLCRHPPCPSACLEAWRLPSPHTQRIATRPTCCGRVLHWPGAARVQSGRREAGDPQRERPHGKCNSTKTTCAY